MERIVSDINMLFEHLIFFYVVFRMEYRKIKKGRMIALGVWVLVWICSSIAGFEWQQNFIGPLELFSIWIYVTIWFLFEISVREMIVMGIGQWLLLSMLENVLFILLQPLQMKKTMLGNAAMLLVSCGCLLCYFLFKNKINPKIFRLPIKIWCFLDVIMFVLTAMMTFFTFQLIERLSNSTVVFTGQVLAAFGEVVIIVLLFAMLYFGNSMYDFRRQKDLAEMQKQQQKEYFLQLLEKEEETKSFRHDIINHLLEIQNYCANGECKQMQQYLESVLGVVQKISKSSYDVGNDIVNAVLNYYLRPLREKCSIEIDGYMSEALSVEERDLCVLSANLIKNATEAVSKMSNGKIWITIKEGRKFLYIQVKNTFEGKINFDKKGLSVTSKPDQKNHGIGTRNMMDIVKKNGGTYRMDAAEGIYTVEIYLNI